MIIQIEEEKSFC